MASGLLVVKHRGDAFGKFVNVAVLEGDQIKIVDESGAEEPECPALLSVAARVRSSQLSGGRPSTSWCSWPRRCARTAAAARCWSCRRHRRPGASRSSRRCSTRSAAVLGDGRARCANARPTSHEWQEDLRRAVDAVAGLTAVDGATVHERALRARRLRRQDHAPAAAARPSSAST